MAPESTLCELKMSKRASCLLWDQTHFWVHSEDYKVENLKNICEKLDGLLSKLPNQANIYFALGKKTFFYKSMHIARDG